MPNLLGYYGVCNFSSLESCWPKSNCKQLCGTRLWDLSKHLNTPEDSDSCSDYTPQIFTWSYDLDSEMVKYIHNEQVIVDEFQAFSRD
jgi:hypothetical protein